MDSIPVAEVGEAGEAGAKDGLEGFAGFVSKGEVKSEVLFELL